LRARNSRADSVGSKWSGRPSAEYRGACPGIAEGGTRRIPAGTFVKALHRRHATLLALQDRRPLGESFCGDVPLRRLELSSEPDVLRLCSRVAQLHVRRRGARISPELHRFSYPPLIPEFTIFRAPYAFS